MENIKLDKFTNFLIDIDGMGKGQTENFNTSILNKPSLFSKADFNQRLALEALDEDLLQVIQQLPFFRKSVKKLLKLRIKPLMRGGSNISNDDYKKIEQLIQPGLNDLECLFNEYEKSRSSMEGGMERSIVTRERTPRSSRSNPTVHQTRPWEWDEIMLLFTHSLCLVLCIGALAVCVIIFIKGAHTYQNLDKFFTSISSVFPAPQERWCKPLENPYKDAGWFSSESSLEQVCRPYDKSWSSFGQYIWGGITTPLEIAGSGINLLGSVLGTTGIALGFYLIVNVLSGPLMTRMTGQAQHIHLICMQHRGEISPEAATALAMGSSAANAQREHEHHMLLLKKTESSNREQLPDALPEPTPVPESTPVPEPVTPEPIPVLEPDMSRLITNLPRSSSIGGKRKKKKKRKAKSKSKKSKTKKSKTKKSKTKKSKRKGR